MLAKQSAAKNKQGGMMATESPIIVGAPGLGPIHRMGASSQSTISVLSSRPPLSPDPGPTVTSRRLCCAADPARSVCWPSVDRCQAYATRLWDEDALLSRNLHPRGGHAASGSCGGREYHATA